MMKGVGCRRDYSTKFSKAECVRARKGLALPRASHSSEITLVGSCCLHSTLAAVPVRFGVHALVHALLSQKPKSVE